MPGAKRGKQGPSQGNEYETDPDQGLFAGRSVAKRFDSPDGMTVLVGRTARDNDVVTFKLGRPNDFWFHVAAQSGSHVLVRNPDGLDRLPRATLEYARDRGIYRPEVRRKSARGGPRPPGRRPQAQLSLFGDEASR